MSFERVDAGSELGPFRVTKRVASRGRALFQALPRASQKAVCLLELEPEEVSALTPAKGIQHAHLARVHEIFEQDGHALLVFDAIEGATLTERLAKVGKKSTFEAVGTALRVSDALSHLHEAGGVHGFLHTDSVFLDPPERLGPILAFSPLPSDERTFHSPERGATGKPSVADDAWAVAGLLHQMLTGDPPPKEGYASTEEIADAGVTDQQLQTALLHGLHRDPGIRSQDVRPLRRELARWFVEHAGEELFVQSERSSHPPPLPPSSRAPATNAGVELRATAPPSAGKRRLIWLSAASVLVGLAGAWALSAWLGRPKVTLVERPAAAPAAPTATSIDLSEVPVTGAEHAAELDQTASCVASYLPKGAFDKSPDLAWLCSETDSSKGAQKLRTAIVAGAAKPSTVATDAMKLISRMGWYDMAAHAVIRAGCCIDAKPLTLPEPSPGCEPLGELLTGIGRDVVSSKPVDEALGRYDAAIRCEIGAGRGGAFGRKNPPAADEGRAFRDLLQSIEH